MQASLQNPTFTSPGVTPFFTHQNPRPTQIRSSIVCARRKSWRRQPLLNRKTSKLMLDTALAVASNLGIVPPPLTALIREFGGGNGGGSGFRKGGGGGFGWWRRRGRNLGFVLVFIVIGLGLLAGGKIHSDVVWCGLGLALIGGAIGCWDVRFGDWVLGFCSCAGVVGLLGLRREEVSKWVQKIRACVSDLGRMGMVRGAKSRRSAFWRKV